MLTFCGVVLLFMGGGRRYHNITHSEKARISAFESQLRQMGIAPGAISGGHIASQFPLLSPITGTVGQITANTGAFVQPGTSIMEVVDNSKIH